jgi:hypothetical protein
VLIHPTPIVIEIYNYNFDSGKKII